MEAVEALIAVLEKEIKLGEELLANVAAQADAFFSWNVSALIGQLEKRETLLRRLSRTEEERREVLGRFSRDVQPPAFPLSRMVSGIFPESRQIRLDQVRKRALAIYRCLQTEESILLGLIGDLLEHFKEAMCSLINPGVRIYGQKGDILTCGSGKRLIHGKV